MSGPRPSVVAVATDLDALVGIRSRSAIRDRALPALDSLLPDGPTTDREDRFRRLQSLIDDAIDSLADPAHQAAADALLGLGPLRWQALKQRGSQAAAAFNLSWDGYRRRRSNGTSLRDDTIHALASAVLARQGFSEDVPPTASADPPLTGASSTAVVADSTSAPDDLAAGTDRPPEPPEDHRDVEPDRPSSPSRRPRRPRRGLVAAVGLAAVAVVVATGLVVTRRPPAEPPSCGTRTYDYGQALDGGPDLRPWTDLFEAFGRTSEASAHPCAGPLSRSADGLVFQEISAGGASRVHALVGVAQPEPSVLFLSKFEWMTAREQGDDGKGLGLPLREIDRPGSERAVQFERGLVYREHAQAPPLAITGQHYVEWQELGGWTGLGPPRSKLYTAVDVGRVQVFENGRLVTDFNGRMVERANPTHTTPNSSGGAILKTPDLTSWWIDPSGTRHWLVTPCAFDRVRESQGVEPVEADTTVVASFEIGEEVVC